MWLSTGLNTLFLHTIFPNDKDDSCTRRSSLRYRPLYLRKYKASDCAANLVPTVELPYALTPSPASRNLGRKKYKQVYKCRNTAETPSCLFSKPFLSASRIVWLWAQLLQVNPWVLVLQLCQKLFWLQRRCIASLEPIFHDVRIPLIQYIIPSMTPSRPAKPCSTLPWFNSNVSERPRQRAPWFVIQLQYLTWSPHTFFRSRFRLGSQVLMNQLLRQSSQIPMRVWPRPSRRCYLNLIKHCELLPAWGMKSTSWACIEYAFIVYYLYIRKFNITEMFWVCGGHFK